MKKVSDCGWTFNDLNNINNINDINDIKEKERKTKGKDWFEKNLGYFKFYGRDIEALLSKTKIIHSRRVFCKGVEEKRKLLLKDLEKGFECFLKNEEVKKRKEDALLKNTIYSMYV